MNEVAHKYKTHFSDRSFILSVLLGFVFLFLSLVINFYAGTFATENASNYVNDIILNNIPLYRVDYIFIYGPFIMWVFVGLICLREPNKIPFLLKSIALFVVIRSIFITLTHLGPFPDQLNFSETSDLLERFSFGGDLFFSAHTGLPFLMALLFSYNRFLCIFFTILAIFFGIIVLMGHLHYSIDVLAAFFITFTIFHLAQFFFKKDWRLFLVYAPEKF